VLEFMNSDVENDYTFAEDYAKLMWYDAIKYPTEWEIRIINASKVKPKKIPLKTSWVDNLIEEAKKYKSAEEFAKWLKNLTLQWENMALWEWLSLSLAVHHQWLLMMKSHRHIKNWEMDAR
jgi:hypothetical protein